jgi:polyisoprenoid-binding protein YceI
MDDKRTPFKVLLKFVPVLLLMACTSEPKSDEAIVDEAKNVITKYAETVNYHLSGGNYISWVGTKPTGRQTGTIRISQGFISFNNNRIVGGRILMDMNDIKINEFESDPDNHAKLSKHLKSPDFFDVKSHPEAEFVLTRLNNYDSSYFASAVKESDFIIKDPNYLASGNLTLRDSTLNITFPLKVIMNDSSIILSAAFNIDRTQWGVSYRDETKLENRIKDKFIHNKVNIAFDLRIKK